jgi:cytochrome b6-f complex iron-sulfur subunit
MGFGTFSTRRKLLLFGAAIASSFSAAIAARGQNSPKPSPSPRADGFTPVVGPASLLEKAGKVLTDKVLIIRNKANKQLVAVSPACPHRHCIVDWQQETQHFVCPCHASEFGTDGKVLKGPSEKGLQVFDVKIEENRFFIKPR